MAVGLFITIFLLFHRISSSNSSDEGSSSSYTHQFVYPINLRSGQRNLNGTRQELVEARGKISGLCERPTKIGAALKAGIDSKVAEMSRTFSALKADFEKEVNETRKENAEVERKLRSESMELKAELATKITELRAQF
ncbi:unnamed protein product, partial [Mesorhabditis belari]|uniref:Uncharacterized protein n=1 Tax=Mesorhabditis belari TaxID=2138241 RepID=A0AAF3EQA8_9BILA